MTDHAALGRANRRKGHDAERAVARYLQTHGWPHAERAIRTAYTSNGHTIPDPGDITGTPGLVWQVKDHAHEKITDWLIETEQQRADASADYGILIQRRRGKADPGHWWAWTTIRTLVQIHEDGGASYSEQCDAPVRLQLQHIVPLLWRAGYGSDPGPTPGHQPHPENPSTATPDTGNHHQETP